MLGSEPPPASIQWENPLSRRGWFFPSNVTYAYFNIKNFTLVEVSSRFFSSLYVIAGKGGGGDGGGDGGNGGK